MSLLSSLPTARRSVRARVTSDRRSLRSGSSPTPGEAEQLVNAYGILRERPELAASEGGSYTVDFLQRVLVETVHPSTLTDALLLLSCLNQLAHDDGKPMFIW